MCFKGCWVVVLPQKHNWFYHHQGNGFYWPFWPKTRVKVDTIWLSPWLVAHGKWSNGQFLCSPTKPLPEVHQQLRAVIQLMPLGVQQCSVWNPELLAVVCFMQKKTKPFTEPGKRSLPRLVANRLQSSSAVLISALALVWAKHTWAHGFSLIFLSHPQLQTSCFHFWSLYRLTALFCVCRQTDKAPLVLLGMEYPWLQWGRGGCSEKPP